MCARDRASDITAASGGAHIPADAAAERIAEAGGNVAPLMLDLLPLASRFSRPVLSGFHVGAVAQGTSGALYFGANLEFPGCPLNQTIHAEQAAVVHAASHGEPGLQRLAVSAAPCGYCRQFLYELATADDLEIIVADAQASKLPQYLPAAFGPPDLGVAPGMLTPQQHRLQYVEAAASRSAGIEAAFQSATACYAPYTGAYGAAAITTRDGQVFSGGYLENAAFNPSVSPLQSALIVATLSGRNASEFATVHVVQRDDSQIDHAAAAQMLMAKLAPQVRVERTLVRVVRPGQAEIRL